MSYLKEGFQQTIKVIKEHKVLFVLLIVLQIIFLLSLSYTALTYQIKILEDSQLITQTLDTANYDEQALQEGQPFLKDMSAILKAYDSLKKSVICLILISFLLFIVLNGLLWIGTHYLFDQTRKLKVLAGRCLKYTLATLLFLGSFLIISYFLAKELFVSSQTSFGNLPYLLGGLFFIAYYFLFAASGLINIPSWKKFIKSFFEISIEKFYLTLPILLINLALIFLSIYLWYYVLSTALVYLIMVAVLIFIIILVVTRIFAVAALRKIQ